MFNREERNLVRQLYQKPYQSILNKLKPKTRHNRRPGFSACHPAFRSLFPVLIACARNNDQENKQNKNNPNFHSFTTESHTFIPPYMIDLLTLHTMWIHMDRC